MILQVYAIARALATFLHEYTYIRALTFEIPELQVYVAIGFLFRLRNFEPFETIELGKILYTNTYESDKYSKTTFEQAATQWAHQRYAYIFCNTFLFNLCLMLHNTS